MPTASLFRAALSAAAVAILFVLLRRAGGRASGLASAVPISSMPALFWLSQEHGGEYAAPAALGALWGTGFTMLLGLMFGKMARAWHPGVAGAMAWFAIGALAVTVWAMPTPMTAATVVAIVLLIHRQVDASRHTEPVPGRALRHANALPSIAMAGAMSWLVSELAPYGGPQFCGLIATVPVVGMSALIAGHRQGGAPLMLRVLDGYLGGMLAKAAFLAALWWAWSAQAGAWAWGIALVVGATALLAQQQWRGKGAGLRVALSGQFARASHGDGTRVL